MWIKVKCLMVRSGGLGLCCERSMKVWKGSRTMLVIIPVLTSKKFMCCMSMKPENLLLIFIFMKQKLIDISKEKCRKCLVINITSFISLKQHCSFMIIYRFTPACHLPTHVLKATSHPPGCFQAPSLFHHILITAGLWVLLVSHTISVIQLSLFQVF